MRLVRTMLLVGLCSACELLAPPPPDPADIFDGPLPGLTAGERAAFVRGDEAFGRQFAPSEGLGPLFNNVSCASCHSGDGRGRPGNALIRFDGTGGPQIQDRAIAGALPEQLPPGTPPSIRLPPPVFGAGLIEAIADSAILARADPDDADGDGISGRPNWDTSGDGAPRLGRFSRKAQVGSLLRQAVEAYHQDIGITSDFLPVEEHAADRVPDPEIAASEVHAVLAYLRTLAPPAPGAMTESRVRGERLFGEIGCAACHVPELRTGPSDIAALSKQPVRLFSDLLLHDMGEELADHRPDGEASGREWRTTPLWGLRIMSDFLNGDAFLMHDARARTVEDAILMHGGEAQAARDAFAALPADLRAMLLDVVGSR